MDGSAPRDINTSEWKMVALGSIYIILDSFLNYIPQVVPLLNLGKWTPVVSGIIPILGLILHIWGTDNRLPVQIIPQDSDVGTTPIQMSNNQDQR